MIPYDPELERHDRELTLRNRGRLFKNKNLLFWYEKLFECQFLGITDIREKKILEIGSGTSPLKIFFPNAIASDILNLDYLDIVFDCHEIDQCKDIEHESCDVIVSTNVLHHLQDPLAVLLKASLILKKGGCFILTEPFFSSISKFIYRKFHHEISSFDITEPKLKSVYGPLSSANQALPYMIFFGNRDWDHILKSVYKFDITATRHFSSLSYMMTGGISRRIPIPFAFYKFLFKWDMKLSNTFPTFFSSFFILRLEKR